MTADPLRQECERRAEKALPCNCGMFEAKGRHHGDCTAYYTKAVADALEEAIRPLHMCLDNIYELGRVTMATEIGREMIMDALRESLAPYRTTPQAEPKEPSK